MDRSSPPPTWTPRRVAAAVFFVAFVLGVQVLLPASRLRCDRPVRFGWHMYAHLPERVVFRVVGPGGEAATVHEGQLVANLRPELRTDEWGPEAICRRLPGAELVRVEVDGQWTRDHRCRR